MRQPDIWSVGAIKGYNVNRCIHSIHTGGDLWVPARPAAHTAFSWRWRFKLAWNVLIGKFDALSWEE